MRRKNLRKKEIQLIQYRKEGEKLRRKKMKREEMQ